jgi:hypothetical protein
MVCIILVAVMLANSCCREASYKDMKINKPICDSYVSAMNAIGYSAIFDAAGQEGGLSGGSTDMGGCRVALQGFVLLSRMSTC